MEQTLRDLAEASSLPEIRRRLGEHLGLGESVEESVVMAAIVYPDYGRRLMTAAGAPELVRHLIAAAPRVDPDHPRFMHRTPSNTANIEAGSSLQLAADASASLLRWATRAFIPVDEATFARRWSACESCNYLSKAPDRVVYKIATALESDKRVCGRCGCVAARKARIPHESCPAAHPQDAALTRWGEPMTHESGSSSSQSSSTTRRKEE